VIGYVGITNSEDEAGHLSAFRQGIGESGFIEGKNVLIEYRWPEGHYDRYADLVADLVKSGVTLITTLGNSTAAVAAKAATSTIPIVACIRHAPDRQDSAGQLPALPWAAALSIGRASTSAVRK
jgi:putative ABC transport system substrate-binding protein